MDEENVDLATARPIDTDERVVLGPHDVYLAAPGVWHGDSVFIGDDELDECWILDVFAPPRDDLRDG